MRPISILIAIVTLCVGCGSTVVIGTTADAGSDAGSGGEGGGTAGGGAGGGSAGGAGGSVGGGTGGGASLAPVDAAEILSDTLPTQLGCSEQKTATVTVRNTGTTTWTEASAYRLGAIDNSDPLSAQGRIFLAAGESVAPGATHIFTLALVAPATNGVFVTDWQMLQEQIRWFGGIAKKTVTVSSCATFNFSQTTIYNSPLDIATWAQTARITQLKLTPTGVAVDFTKRDGAGSWPDVPYLTPGEDLQYTLWIVLKINGQWYASGCIEYWRRTNLDVINGGPPNQYAMNWYYDANRWQTMTGHQPAVGEEVGFFVAAGDHRNNGQFLIKERSNIVFISFPTAAGATFNYP